MVDRHIITAHIDDLVSVISEMHWGLWAIFRDLISLVTYFGHGVSFYSILHLGHPNISDLTREVHDG